MEIMSDIMYFLLLSSISLHSLKKIYYATGKCLRLKKTKNNPQNLTGFKKITYNENFLDIK